MKSIKLLYMIILSVGSIVSCTNNSQTNPTLSQNSIRQKVDSLDLRLSNIQSETLIPGFAVHIFREDETIFSKGFGYADLANNASFTPKTIHTVASISKTVIGLAVMKLVETGKLNLDSPVNDYLAFEVRNPHYPEEVITVRHLVTHTSSLNDNYDDGEKRPSTLIEKSIYSDEEIPESLAQDIFYFDGSSLPLEDYLKHIFSPEGQWYEASNYSNFKPGDQYEYSNEGATLAALIVEKIAQMPFSKFTEEHIFKPLGMVHTSWFYDTLDTSVSKLYVPDDYDNPSKVYEFPRFHEAGYPAGDLKTTAVDLSKYLAEVIKGFQGNGSLLITKSYQTLLKPQLDRSQFEDHDEHALNDEYNVGAFWAISKPGLRLHKGGSIGVYSVLYFNPKNEVGVIAFCNLAHPDFGKIVHELRAFEKSLE